jgi:hypothetical protein
MAEFQKLMVALTFFSGTLAVTVGRFEDFSLASVLVELLAQPAAESSASRSTTTLILTRVFLRRQRRFSSAANARRFSPLPIWFEL